MNPCITPNFAGYAETAQSLDEKIKWKIKMKIVNTIKYFMGVASIVFLFINWKISIALFLAASIIQIIPHGPGALLSVIIGYLILGGLVFLFINWKIGVLLIVCGFLTTRFRIYANKINREYYSPQSSDNLNSTGTKQIKEDS